MVNLRPARESDLPHLIALAKRSWSSAFTGCAPDEFVREWLARDFENEWYPKYRHEMTVAEIDGVVVGLVQPTKDEINGLWVDPAAQSQGVGTALLSHGEKEIAAAGYDRCWLSCSSFNPKAQRFYLARGYQHVRSEAKPRAGGVIEDMCYYEFALPRIRQPEHPQSA